MTPRIMSLIFRQVCESFLFSLPLPVKGQLRVYTLDSCWRDHYLLLASGF